MQSCYTPCKQGLDSPAQSCSIILPANRGSIPSCAELFYYSPCKDDTILHRAVQLYSQQTGARYHPAQSCSVILPANRGSIPACTELFYYTLCKQGLDTILHSSIILPANRGSKPSCAELFYYNPCKQGLDTILYRAVLLYSLQTGAGYHPAQSCSVILLANKGSIQSCAELFYYTPCKQGLDSILHRAVLLYSLQTRARHHPAQSCSIILPVNKGERGGSVVECRTPEREVRGSRPTAAVLCP